MRFLSSQAIPITRPFAPHLVVLEDDGNACTSHMEFLKLYFSFQWTFNSFETLPRKTLHLALPRPNFGNPITRPAPEAGFFIGKHHLWCGRGSLIERDRNSTWRQGSQSAKKKAQRAFSGCEELESLWGEPTDRVLAASLCHSRDRPANKCHCDSGVTNMILWGEKLTWWKQGHTHVDLSEPLPLAGVSFCSLIRTCFSSNFQCSMDGSMTDKESLVEQVFAKYRSYCKEIGITPAEMMQQAYLSHLKGLTMDQLKAKLWRKPLWRWKSNHDSRLSNNAQTPVCSSILNIDQ